MQRSKTEKTTHLPNEIIICISEYLNDIKDFMNILFCCKSYFNDFLLNDDYCINLFFKNFNLKTIKIFDKIFIKIPIYIKNKIKYLNFNNLLKNDKLLNDCLNVEELILGRFYNSQYLDRNSLQNLVNLQKLKSLSISSMNINYVINFPQNIESLYLCDSNVKDLQLNNLINLTNLTVKKEEDFNGSCLQNFTKLKKLNVDRCGSFGGKHFNKLNNLTSLTFSGRNYIDSNQLQNLQNLKHLTIERTGFNDEDLKGLVNLESLYICGEYLNGTCLQNFIKLKILIIKSVEDNILLQITKNCCKTLQYLEVGEYVKDDDNFFNYLKQFKYVKINDTILKENELMENYVLNSFISVICWNSNEVLKIANELKENLNYCED
ncbi:hypothetical protein ABK040_011754 [Willaertia magna]